MLHPVRGNPCAMYGAGFIKIEGTNTCVKIGGSVSVESGGSVRRWNLSSRDGQIAGGFG